MLSHIPYICSHVLSHSLIDLLQPCCPLPTQLQSAQGPSHFMQLLNLKYTEEIRFGEDKEN